LDHIEPPTRPEVGPVVSRISREVVQLHAKLYGRGPTRAKTFLDDDYALTILENVFTPAERTLIGADQAHQVHATRDAFQNAVAHEFIAIAEGATGRKVRSFISAVHTDADIAVELWLFEPADDADEAPARTEETPDG
jgi:uncharacterized protein YbcI